MSRPFWAHVAVHIARCVAGPSLVAAALGAQSPAAPVASPVPPLARAVRVGGDPVAGPAIARPAPAGPPTIAVLLYDGFTALDAVGPLQMLGMLHMQGWRVVTVAKVRGPVRTDAGLTVEAQQALAEVPRADVLVVPGGLEGTYRAARDTTITHWIGRVHAGSRVTASVCTGAWILAGAGVLRRGDTAATHWLGREELERAGVVYTPERVHRPGPGGRVWTAAGVSAGLDLGLALVETLGGRTLAEHAQLLAQYDPKPPFDAGTPEKAPAAAAALRAAYARLMAGVMTTRPAGVVP